MSSCSKLSEHHRKKKRTKKKKKRRRRAESRTSEQLEVLTRATSRYGKQNDASTCMAGSISSVLFSGCNPNWYMGPLSARRPYSINFERSTPTWPSYPLRNRKPCPASWPGHSFDGCGWVWVCVCVCSSVCSTAASVSMCWLAVPRVFSRRHGPSASKYAREWSGRRSVTWEKSTKPTQPCASRLLRRGIL